MTTDERLDKLTERHEALTQSIEIMHRDWEDRFRQITNTFELALNSIKRLENIAFTHDHRLDSIEGNGN